MVLPWVIPLEKHLGRERGVDTRGHSIGCYIGAAIGTTLCPLEAVPTGVQGALRVYLLVVP